MFTWEVISMILVWHFFGDFVFQKEKWAKTKSSSMISLSLHCLTYGVIMFIVMPFLSPMWAIFNMLAHFVIDYFTSRIMKPLWEKEQFNDFFFYLGLDQAMHYLILFSSYKMFYEAGFIHFLN